jgi:hypothetical protein
MTTAIRSRRILGWATTTLLATGAAAPWCLAQDIPSLNFYGTVGGIDMPSGLALPDGMVTFGYAQFGPNSRTSVGFQISPRLSGTFRYAGVRDWDAVIPDSGFDTYYDRSFDLRYQILFEGRYIPAVTIGLQDLAGTGLYGGEYIAATKHIHPNLTVTGGLGWGRLGSYNSFGSGSRPEVDIGEGGRPNWDTWFRGPAAPFAGVEWLIGDRWGVKAEYSSDAYTVEAEERGTFERKTPFNFGVEYRLSDQLRLGAYSLYGSEVGFSLQFTLNPKVRLTGLGINDPAPPPLTVRPARSLNPALWSEDWASTPSVPGQVREVLGAALAPQGLYLDALDLRPTSALIRVQNIRYDSAAQALGRTARILSGILPPSIETFEIEMVVNGIAASRVTLKRSDLEALEFAPAGDIQLAERATIAAGGVLPPEALMGSPETPRFTWQIVPAFRTSLFDPDQPFRADLRIRAQGSYQLAEGLFLSGAVSQALTDNLGAVSAPPESALPPVRTNTYLYDLNGQTELESLDLSYYRRLGGDFYGRATVGYLERMFGGASVEALWMPVDSPLALGATLSYVSQRSYDDDFSFLDYSTLTGHASAYYEFTDGYLAQLDVGQYLAGDVGATLSITRIFPNGWQVGAFATLTDVSAEEFGEGSFDKGIRIVLPVNWAIGQSSRARLATTLRPVTRDGGAFLNNDRRLYWSLRDYNTDGYDSQWGRVWR